MKIETQIIFETGILKGYLVSLNKVIDRELQLDLFNRLERYPDEASTHKIMKQLKEDIKEQRVVTHQRGIQVPDGLGGSFALLFWDIKEEQWVRLDMIYPGSQDRKKKHLVVEYTLIKIE